MIRIVTPALAEVAVKRTATRSPLTNIVSTVSTTSGISANSAA